jgi:uncharacterized protein YebE (UPF0316 family)
MEASVLYAWLLLPALIFVARVIDVSLGTLRIVFIARHQAGLAAITGFFEVLVWLLASVQVFGGDSSWWQLLAYAGGYAAGNYAGLWLEQRLAMGSVAVHMTLCQRSESLLPELARAGFGYHAQPGSGSAGPVTVVEVVSRRRDLPRLQALIKAVAPAAFVTIEEVRAVCNGFFPPIRRSRPQLWLQPLLVPLRRLARPGK